MSQKPPSHSGPVLISGQLKTNGQPYSVHILDESWVEAIHALHIKVINSLKPDEKAFVLPKTKEFFEDHLKSGGIIVGAISDGKLIGKAVMRELGPDGSMLSLSSPPPVEKTAILQCDTVDPDYQGNGIMQKLTHARVLLAHMRGREHICAEVVAGNTASLKVFFKCGLTLKGTDTDPADGSQLYNLHETTENAILTSAFNKAAAHENTSAVDLHDIKAINEKLANGYHGVAVKSPEKKLLMTLKNSAKKKVAP